MPIPDDWFDDDHKPRSEDERQRAYGGKDADAAFEEDLMEMVREQMNNPAPDDEGEAEPTEDKFLPRRKR
jgi:hypothetical protein